MGFVAVHDKGLALCEKDGDLLALLWLCRRGDVVGWGEPFECSNQALCSASKCGRGWVRSFLRRMVQADVLEVVDAGSKSAARVVCMKSPFPPKKVIHERDHLPDHDADHNNTGSTGEVDGGDSPLGLPLGPQHVQYRDPDHTKDKTTDKKNDVQAVWDANREHHPRRRAKPGDNDARYIRARLKESGLETCLLVARWANHPSSWYSQNSRCQISTLYKADKWSGRVEGAEQWERVGPSRGAPSRRDPYEVICECISKSSRSAMEEVATGAGYDFDEIVAAMKRTGITSIQIRQANEYESSRLRKAINKEFS